MPRLIIAVLLILLSTTISTLAELSIKSWGWAGVMGAHNQTFDYRHQIDVTTSVEMDSGIGISVRSGMRASKDYNYEKFGMPELLFNLGDLNLAFGDTSDAVNFRSHPYGSCAGFNLACAVYNVGLLPGHYGSQVRPTFIKKWRVDYDRGKLGFSVSGDFANDDIVLGFSLGKPSPVSATNAFRTSEVGVGAIPALYLNGPVSPSINFGFDLGSGGSVVDAFVPIQSGYLGMRVFLDSDHEMRGAMYGAYKVKRTTFSGYLGTDNQDLLYWGVGTSLDISTGVSLVFEAFGDSTPCCATSAARLYYNF